jgi:bifunctional UDP-N-acetylglucosamine pyrophosphorylase/glucosamine-1-phosphate N-acetyltransferase
MKAGLFEALRRLQPRRFLKMPGRFPRLSLDRDILAITDAVLELQARRYRETGVLILDPRNFFIEGLPQVGQGSEIATGVVLCGQSSIGQHVRICPYCYVENCTIGDRSVIFPHSVLVNARIEEDVCVGPFARLREGACVRRGAKVGNFVEMKKSVLGRGSKAMHLSYLGDAEIGEQVNIGAGTITCNYDGEKKNPTLIEDHVFIGSNSALIAPLILRHGSYVAAGSTITENVPAGALAIARQRQRNISGWVARKKKKKK